MKLMRERFYDSFNLKYIIYIIQWI